MSFGELASRFEKRFGKGTLQAASQVQHHDPGVQVEFGANGGSAGRALGATVLVQVLHEQSVLRLTMGCQNPPAGRKLIHDPSITLDEAVRRVKTYQLNQPALAPRRRGVHSVSRDSQSPGGAQSRSPSLHGVMIPEA